MTPFPRAPPAPLHWSTSPPPVCYCNINHSFKTWEVNKQDLNTKYIIFLRKSNQGKMILSSNNKCTQFIQHSFMLSWPLDGELNHIWTIHLHLSLISHFIILSIWDYTASHTWFVPTWPLLKSPSAMCVGFFLVMCDTGDHCGEKRIHSVFLCISLPLSSFIFLCTCVDLWCRWSEVDGGAGSQLLQSTNISVWTDHLFGVRNLYPPPLPPGSTASWVVMWWGSFGMARATGGPLWQHSFCFRADDLTSRNMWNNNDRKPADRFSNITPHNPQNHLPHPALSSFLKKSNGLLITVMLSFYLLEQ